MAATIVILQISNVSDEVLFTLLHYTRKLNSLVSDYLIKKNVTIFFIQ